MCSIFFVFERARFVNSDKCGGKFGFILRHCPFEFFRVHSVDCDAIEIILARHILHIRTK